MAKDASAENQGEKKSRFPLDKILLAAFVAVNLLGTLGGAAAAYLGTMGLHPAPITEASAQTEREGKVQVEEATGGIVYTLDPFTVNLDGKPRRTMRAVITLEMLDNRGFEEVVNLGAGARDSIVRLLNSKSFSQLESVQGKLFLKDEIATQLNQYLKAGVVKNVYFSEFVVQ